MLPLAGSHGVFLGLEPTKSQPLGGRTHAFGQRGPGARIAAASEKKKSHRKRNLLVTREREIVYLGPISPGSVHDKKLADESGLSFPPQSWVLEDSGFQGYEAPGAGRTLRPKKKSRGRELSAFDKALNELLSRYRVVVEHAIGGVKRCRIVLDTFRCWRQDLVDEVMLAASGLQNLRGTTRAMA